LPEVYRQAQEASGAHAQRLAAESAALEAEVRLGNENLVELEGRHEEAKRLQRATHEASKRIVERA